MRGMYKRLGGGLCALLMGFLLAGCEAPVDGGAILAGGEGASQARENASSRQGESAWEAGGPTAQPPAWENGAVPAGEPGLLTEEQAKEQALAHGQFSAGEVDFTKVKLDREHGRQVYEIEFVTGDRVAYDYEIDAASGEVLAWEREDAPGAAPTQQPAQTPGQEPISMEEAKDIALAKVPGASAEDIVQFKTEWENGRTVYEGEILFGGMEYEFAIDGATGTVLEWDAEAFDH